MNLILPKLTEKEQLELELNEKEQLELELNEKISKNNFNKIIDNVNYLSDTISEHPDILNKIFSKKTPDTISKNPNIKKIILKNTPAILNKTPDKIGGPGEPQNIILKDNLLEESPKKKTSEKQNIFGNNFLDLFEFRKKYLKYKSKYLVLKKELNM